MSWGAVIGAAGAIGGGLLASSGAKKAAKAATPVPYGVSGPAGTSTVNGKNITLSMRDNPFAALFQALGLGQLGQVGGYSNQFLYGANPEVANAYRGIFGQGLTQEIQSQLDLLRQAAAPEEQRQFNRFQDSIFARTGGATSGDTDRFRAFEEAMAQADLQRQLSAVGMGRENALNRFQAAMGAVGQGMSGQQQAFNLGMGAFGGTGDLFQRLIQQAGLGVGAGGGTPPQIAQWAAQQQQLPFQTAFNFLNNSGILNRPGYNPIYGGGGVPMVGQPAGGVVVTPPSQFPMPTVPGF